MAANMISAELAGSPLSPLWQRVIIYASVAAIVPLAAWVTVTHPYTPASNLGYYMGLAGSLMMLSLLLYPVRKRWGRLQNFGTLKSWFLVHIIFGILGPVLVLFHTTFHLRAFNSNVAFWSMVGVIVSGFIGRVVYIRIYEGVGGRRLQLWEMEGLLQARPDKAFHALDLVPHVRAWLNDYRNNAFLRQAPAWKKIARFVVSGWIRRRLIARCHRQVKRALAIHAKRVRWTRSRLLLERTAINALIEEYVHATDLTARMAYWVRLLAWWNIAHVPLVYVLVLSAVAHVVAVHLY
jgi:hypothetical protein